MARQRLPSVVDASVSAVPKRAAALSAERITVNGSTSAEDMPRQVARIERNLRQLSEASRSHPMLGAPIIFKRVQFGSAGAKTFLTHNLGGTVQYMPVRWRGPGGSGTVGAGISIEESNDAGDVTATRIAWKSYQAGEADLLVWLQP